MAKYSLLAKKEEKRNLRRAALFGFLTVVLLVFLFSWGLPALVKMAVFLGDIKSSSQPVEKKDNLPPQTPILDPLPEATNSAQIKVSGLSEQGAKIKIFLTGIEIKEVVADKEGSFSFPNLELSLGKNEIYAVAIDQEENQSPASAKTAIWYDNEAPNLEITQPSDQTTITESNGKVEIIGKTDPEAEVLINGHLVILDKDGNFKYNLGLSVGENKILIIATDTAGNKEEKTLTVNYSP